MSTHLLECDKLNSGMNINLATLDQSNHSSNTASHCQPYPVTDVSEVVKVLEEAIIQKHSHGRDIFTGFLTAEPGPLPELALWTRRVVQAERPLSPPGKREMRLVAFWEHRSLAQLYTDPGECMPVHSVPSCKLTLETALKDSTMLNLLYSSPMLVLTSPSYSHTVAQITL